ncbi:MAG: hypothetical protein WAL72_33920 [Streptosporangiaceae bacterium]
MATEVVTGGEDAMEPGFALSEIDTTTPHPARMHDALLGGCDQPAASCEAHHVIHRKDGGHTSLTNVKDYCWLGLPDISRARRELLRQVQ